MSSIVWVLDSSYEQLEMQLFPKGEQVDRTGGSKSGERPKKGRKK